MPETVWGRSEQDFEWPIVDHDILIAVTDGLKGMGEALAAVYPATLQTCIVHLIRNSPDYANWKDRRALAAAIKPICTATSAEHAEVGRNVRSRGQHRPTATGAAGTKTA